MRAALTFALACGLAAPALNVLHVIVDDLRPDLGCYGREWAQTPHFNTLARHGFVFTQAHAAIANCAPSRASFMLGRRPDWTGVVDLNTHFRDRDPRAVTLPQALRESAHRYLTVSYGKVFHQRQDDAASWSPQSEFADNHTCRGARGECHQPARAWDYWQYMVPSRRDGGNVFERLFERGPDDNPRGLGYTDRVIADQARAALARLAAQPRPWYVAVGFVRPHLPFNAPSAFFDAIVPWLVPPPPRVAAARSWSRLSRRSVFEGLTELTANFHAQNIGGLLSDHATGALTKRGRVLAAAYHAAVSFVDAQFGRVIQRLHETSMAPSTVIVMHGDHGFKLGHFGSWGKHSLMTQDTHVPLIVSVPRADGRRAGARAAGRVDRPVGLLDVYPTLLELAGVAPDYATLHGRSLRPALRAARAPDDERADAAAVAISQWPFGLDYNEETPCMGYAVRVANWTLLQWVLTPVRCTKHECSGPLRGTAEDRAAWSALRTRGFGAHRGVPNPCLGQAELFHTPATYGDTPSVEPDGVNVLDYYPRVTERLRALLAKHAGLDPASLGLGDSLEDEAGGTALKIPGRRRHRP